MWQENCLDAAPVFKDNRFFDRRNLRGRIFDVRPLDPPPLLPPDQAAVSEERGTSMSDYRKTIEINPVLKKMYELASMRFGGDRVGRRPPR